MPCKYNDDGTPMAGTVWSAPPAEAEIARLTATLVERLNKRGRYRHPEMPLGHQWIPDPDCQEAAARIAELEAELDDYRGVVDIVTAKDTRIAELEAERDRLIERLKPFAAEYVPEEMDGINDEVAIGVGTDVLRAAYLAISPTPSGDTSPQAGKV